MSQRKHDRRPPGRPPSSGSSGFEQKSKEVKKKAKKRTKDDDSDDDLAGGIGDISSDDGFQSRADRKKKVKVAKKKPECTTDIVDLPGPSHSRSASSGSSVRRGRGGKRSLARRKVGIWRGIYYHGAGNYNPSEDPNVDDVASDDEKLAEKRFRSSMRHFEKDEANYTYVFKDIKSNLVGYSKDLLKLFGDKRTYRKLHWDKLQDAKGLQFEGASIGRQQDLAYEDEEFVTMDGKKIGRKDELVQNHDDEFLRKRKEDIANQGAAAFFADLEKKTKRGKAECKQWLMKRSRLNDDVYFPWTTLIATLGYLRHFNQLCNMYSLLGKKNAAARKLHPEFAKYKDKDLPEEKERVRELIGESTDLLMSLLKEIKASRFDWCCHVLGFKPFNYEGLPRKVLTANKTFRDDMCIADVDISDPQYGCIRYFNGVIAEIVGKNVDERFSIDPKLIWAYIQEVKGMRMVCTVPFKFRMCLCRKCKILSERVVRIPRIDWTNPEVEGCFINKDEISAGIYGTTFGKVALLPDDNVGPCNLPTVRADYENYRTLQLLLSQCSSRSERNKVRATEGRNNNKELFGNYLSLLHNTGSSFDDPSAPGDRLPCPRLYNMLDSEADEDERFFGSALSGSKVPTRGKPKVRKGLYGSSDIQSCVVIHRLPNGCFISLPTKPFRKHFSSSQNMTTLITNLKEIVQMAACLKAKNASTRFEPPLKFDSLLLELLYTGMPQCSCRVDFTKPWQETKLYHYDSMRPFLTCVGECKEVLCPQRYHCYIYYEPWKWTKTFRMYFIRDDCKGRKYMIHSAIHHKKIRDAYDNKTPEQVLNEKIAEITAGGFIDEGRYYIRDEDKRFEYRDDPIMCPKSILDGMIVAPSIDPDEEVIPNFMEKHGNCIRNKSELFMKATNPIFDLPFDEIEEVDYTFADLDGDRDVGHLFDIASDGTLLGQSTKELPELDCDVVESNPSSNNGSIHEYGSPEETSFMPTNRKEGIEEDSERRDDMTISKTGADHTCPVKKRTKKRIYIGAQKLIVLLQKVDENLELRNLYLTALGKNEEPVEVVKQVLIDGSPSADPAYTLSSGKKKILGFGDDAVTANPNDAAVDFSTFFDIGREESEVSSPALDSCPVDDDTQGGTKTIKEQNVIFGEEGNQLIEPLGLVARKSNPWKMKSGNKDIDRSPVISTYPSQSSIVKKSDIGPMLISPSISDFTQPTQPLGPVSYRTGDGRFLSNPDIEVESGPSTVESRRDAVIIQSLPLTEDQFRTENSTLRATTSTTAKSPINGLSVSSTFVGELDSSSSQQVVPDIEPPLSVFDNPLESHSLILHVESASMVNHFPAASFRTDLELRKRSEITSGKKLADQERLAAAELPDEYKMWDPSLPGHLNFVLQKLNAICSNFDLTLDTVDNVHSDGYAYAKGLGTTEGEKKIAEDMLCVSDAVLEHKVDIAFNEAHTAVNANFYRANIWNEVAELYKQGFPARACRRLVEKELKRYADRTPSHPLVYTEDAMVSLDVNSSERDNEEQTFDVFRGRLSDAETDEIRNFILTNRCFPFGFNIVRPQKGSKINWKNANWEDRVSQLWEGDFEAIVPITTGCDGRLANAYNPMNDKSWMSYIVSTQHDFGGVMLDLLMAHLANLPEGKYIGGLMSMSGFRARNQRVQIQEEREKIFQIVDILQDSKSPSRDHFALLTNYLVGEEEDFVREKFYLIEFTLNTKVNKSVVYAAACALLDLKDDDKEITVKSIPVYQSPNIPDGYLLAIHLINLVLAKLPTRKLRIQADDNHKVHDLKMSIANALESHDFNSVLTEPLVLAVHPSLSVLDSYANYKKPAQKRFVDSFVKQKITFTSACYADCRVNFSHSGTNKNETPYLSCISCFRPFHVECCPVEMEPNILKEKRRSKKDIMYFRCFDCVGGDLVHREWKFIGSDYYYRIQLFNLEQLGSKDNPNNGLLSITASGSVFSQMPIQCIMNTVECALYNNPLDAKVIDHFVTRISLNHGASKSKEYNFGVLTLADTEGLLEHNGQLNRSVDIEKRLILAKAINHYIELGKKLILVLLELETGHFVLSFIYYSSGKIVTWDPLSCYNEVGSYKKNGAITHAVGYLCELSNQISRHQGKKPIIWTCCVDNYFPICSTVQLSAGAILDWIEAITCGYEPIITGDESFKQMLTSVVRNEICKSSTPEAKDRKSICMKYGIHSKKYFAGNVVAQWRFLAKSEDIVLELPVC